MSKFRIQKSPFKVPTSDGKTILEFWGITTGNPDVSIAYMKAPAGWSEPFQTPEFDEVTLVLKGRKLVELQGEKVVIEAGQSILVEKGATVQYSNPFDETCEYVSVCLPAFSDKLVHRNH